jgi:DHA1 family tetracycline resistance protein-like MFS transporter
MVNKALHSKSLSLFTLYGGFLSFLGFGVLNPLMPTLVQRYGGTAWDVGLLYATFSLAQFLTLPGIGALSDVYGRRLMMLLSLLGASVGYLIFGIGGSLGMLFAGWTIVGLTDGIASTVFALIADSSEKQERTRAFSWVSGAIALGLIIGPILSGVLSRINPTAPVYVVALAFSIAVVWGYFVMVETLPTYKRTSLPNLLQLNPFTQLQASLAFEYLRWLMLSFLIVNMAMFALISNLPALANELFGWKPERIAPLFALFGIVSVVSQIIIIPWLLPKMGEVRMAFWGAIIMVIAFILYSIFPITGLPLFLYSASLIVGIGQPLAETSLVGLISRSASSEVQGRISSSIQTVQALARIIAPLLAGWLYQNISPNAPYLFSVGIITFAAGIIKIAIPQTKLSLQNSKNNNVVLITGGASGIGLALATKFLQSNNKVIITGRNQEKLAEVKEVFPDIITEIADITNLDALQKLVNKHPDVNILINNAGIQYNYDFTDSEITAELIDTELRTNLIAPLQLIKLILPHLLTKPNAAIINVTSGLGLFPSKAHQFIAEAKQDFTSQQNLYDGN